MSECKSCHQPIFWVVTEKGTVMPVDTDPVAGGNITLQRQGQRLIATVHSTPSDDDQPRYVSHFVTCPQSKEWRRKK